MATLLTLSDSDSTRRCDAGCYEATSSRCRCICEGRNHGVGLARAQENLRRDAFELGAAGLSVAETESAQGDLFA